MTEPWSSVGVVAKHLGSYCCWLPDRWVLEHQVDHPWNLFNADIWAHVGRSEEDKTLSKSKRERS